MWARRLTFAGFVFFRGLVFLCLLIAGDSVETKEKAGKRPTFDSLFKALGGENYAEARRQADIILTQGNPSDRRNLVAPYCRILLSLGNRQAAQKFVSKLQKAGPGGDLGQLMWVYDA